MRGSSAHFRSYDVRSRAPGWCLRKIGRIFESAHHHWTDARGIISSARLLLIIISSPVNNMSIPSSPTSSICEVLTSPPSAKRPCLADRRAAFVDNGGGDVAVRDLNTERVAMIAARVRRPGDSDEAVEARIIRLPEFLSFTMKEYNQLFNEWSAGRKKVGKQKIPKPVGDKLVEYFVREWGVPNVLEVISDNGKRKMFEMIRKFLEEQDTGTSSEEGIQPCRTKSTAWRRTDTS